MNRLSTFLVIAVAVAASCAPASAQATTPFTVSAEPYGSTFVVDGQTYKDPVTFSWPIGSKHVLQWIPSEPDGSQIDKSGNYKYTFNSWTDSTGLLGESANMTQTVTADPAVKFYKANVSVLYKVNIVAYLTDPLPKDGLTPPTCAAPGDQPPSAQHPGVFYVGGTCYWNSTSLWLPAGNVTLNAFPFPGYVFLGWSVNTEAPNAYLSTFNITGPVTIAPYFALGKRAKIVTEPTGLKVTVDGTLTPTPPVLPCDSNHYLPPIIQFTNPTSVPTTLCVGEFDFAMDSKHTLGAPAVQSDANGNLWVLDSFTLSGGTGTIQNNVYTANSVNSITTDYITAHFLPALGATFVSNPPLLPLTIDGRSDWKQSSFYWGLGTTHTVSAPSEATDAQGRKYVFKGWSNGGAATQTFTMNGPVVLSANYEKLSRVVLQATGSNVSFTVDGADCPAPCTVDRSAGSSASVSAPAIIPISEVQRLEFDHWQDGASENRTIAFNQDWQGISAVYALANKVTVVVDPPNGAKVDFSPPSQDGFYRADRGLSLIASANPGYKFLHWEGDFFSTNRIISINAKNPRTMRAILGKVPFISPAGVKNAAADIPTNGVAPGSLISIYGVNLASQLEFGPTNPLSQTLSGTMVMLGDRLIPLVYVSPTQINAYLPEDIAPGTYNLTVRNDGASDIAAEVKVVRNAPGLFINTMNGKDYVLALHQDGSIITTDSPAKKNETITVLGTGFGPYKQPTVEGFPVPATPVNPLQDPVTITLGGTKVTPSSVEAATGFSGVTAIKFKLPDGVPAASSPDFKATVNGQDSNTLPIPVE